MKFSVAVATSTLLLAISTPAAAGWRTAQWGMTVPQLQKLFPTVSAPEKSATTGSTIMTMKDITFSGIHWYSVYFIMSDTGRLTRVQLMSHENKFPFVQTQLATQFGSPVLKEREKAVFNDAKHRNSVEIMNDDTFGMFLTYSQPSEKF